MGESKDGIIYFSVESDGTTGEDWIMRLEDSSFLVGHHAKQVLRSLDFMPTSRVTTEVAVLRCSCFKQNDRTSEKIRAEADKRKLSKPNAELACLIREKFTDEEIKAMGLSDIVVMHEPINDSDGDSCLLGASLGCWLKAYYYGWPVNKWIHSHGFAFASSSQR